MNIVQNTISIQFAHRLIGAAKRSGLDCQALLQAAGLEETLLQNAQMRITPDQFSRLMRELLRAGDDEFMGMASHRSRHGVFSVMAKQSLHCRNLRSVYHHLGYFYNLVSDALTLKLEIKDNEAHFSMRLTDPEKDPDNILCEFLMLLWHRFPSWLIGQYIPLKRIMLAFPEPKHEAEYRLSYPCPAIFNQPTNSLVFDRALLDAPVVQSPGALSSYLRRAPLDWFQRQAYYPVYTRRVMDYLERDEEQQPKNTMVEIASELHVSTRTLRRKLIKEGTTFQKLKDSVRRDAAIHYLSQPAIPISQISEKLGFSEPASFARVFKQWAGVPPTVYRNG